MKRCKNYAVEKEGKEDEKIDPLSFCPSDLKIISMKEANIWNDSNQLSEEMVLCMRNIFLHLSESSKLSLKASTDSSSSSVERLSGYTLTSFSDASILPSIL